MQRLLRRFAEAFRKSDLILLLLCVIATVFGCLMVASTTNATSAGALRYLIIQIPAAIVGILFYIIIIRRYCSYIW